MRVVTGEAIFVCVDDIEARLLVRCKSEKFDKTILTNNVQLNRKVNIVSFVLDRIT